MQTRLEAFKRDERGAIMVVASFMAAFMVGALWYVAGVGNASIFRESMQSGADAGAFAAAVFHARGMNIIAMINLIMAAILGVLVALKIAYLLLTITAVILDAICAIPTQQWACPLAALAHNGASTVNSIIKSVEPIINNTLKLLSKLQVGVAKVMPVVSLVKSNNMAKMYNKPVEGGLMISESIIPSSGFGLPVEEDKYSVLCDKAAEFVAEFALAPFSVFGVPSKWATGLVKGLVNAAPSYFCGDDGGSGGGGSGGQGGSGGGKPSGNADMAAKTACDEQQKVIDEENKKSKKGKIPFDYEDCIKKNKKKFQQEESKTLGNSSSGGSGGKTPKKVIDAAKNGNKYFQIITYAWGDMKYANLGRSQVRVAAWGKKVLKAPSFWGKIQYGMAEYYYDGSGSWDTLKEEAMWNMKWRARLRRYHKEIAPGGEIVSTAMSILGGVPAGVLEAIDFLQGGGIDDVMGKLNPNQAPASLQDVYTKQGTKTDGQDFDKVDTGTKLEAVH